MIDVSRWLAEQGLGHHAEAFAQNGIAGDILHELTDADLKELGLNLGDRKRLLTALAALDAGPTQDRIEAAQTKRAPLILREAERRQLTVLFCDLVGSTELSARLDPEDLREIIGRYQDACAEVIGRFEGHVARFLGDGALAYFGWPRAHEHAAEKAVRAGLALVEVIARQEPGMQARVGVATGPVVVGDLIGRKSADVDSVIGETPNLAARLQTLAEPGTVVIGEATRRLVGGFFELDDLGPQRLKGFAEPLTVWRVTDESRSDGRFEAMHAAGLTPLVGRDHELSLLLRRWKLAKEGEGQVVLLSGEPGIGKSRLVRELRRRLEEDLHLRLTYQCSPHHTTSPLHPLIEQLEHAAGFARDDPSAARLDKLETLLARGTGITGRLDRAVPLILALLGFPTGERYRLSEMTPQRQKELTLQALVDQLEGLAAVEPVLLVYEDVHWIDPTTQELLGLTIERIQRLPVLALITCRPEFSSPWSGQAHISTVALTRLGRRQGAAIVDHVVGDKALPAEVAAQIVAKTDGVPLFVEELTKAVLDSGLLTDTGDRYELSGPLPRLAIPMTLRDSLMARLDRLAWVKGVAQIGAVIGPEFSYELLAAVADQSEDQLQCALDQLASSELVFRRCVPQEATYSFKHALVQDAAYESLLKSRRKQLHSRIAWVLEQRFPQAAITQPELLARHFTEAGLHDRAIEYWEKAGRRALAACAAVEAIAHLTKGLELLKPLPHGSDRDQRELKIRMVLGPALIATQGSSARETWNTFHRARKLCEQLGVAVPPVVLSGLFLCHLVRGELVSAGDMAEKLLSTARQQQDTSPLCLGAGDGEHDRAELQGHRAVGSVYLFLGRFILAREHLEHVIALHDSERPHSPASVYVFDPLYVFHPWVVAFSYVAIAKFALGYPSEAAGEVATALRKARRLRHRFSLAHARHFACLFHQLSRNPRAVLRRVGALKFLCDEAGFRIYAAGADMLHGWAQVELGQTRKGIAQVLEGLHGWQFQKTDDLRSQETKFLLPYWLALAAEALCRCGREDEALGKLDEAVNLTEQTEERWFQPELHRRRGELLLMLPDAHQAKAEACFRRALEVARFQDAKLWELRAATSLARLWHNRGRQAEAHDLLAPVYGWFTEGFETADLKDPKALLDELA